MFFSGSIALTYFSIQNGFIYVVFTYGFLSSLGVGIAYVAPLAAGMKVILNSNLVFINLICF